MLRKETQTDRNMTLANYKSNPHEPELKYHEP